MTVNKERVELFAQALESDRYHKCSGHLQYFLLGGGELNCALGVATHVALKNGLANREYLWSTGVLNPAVRDWYGFDLADPVVTTPPEGVRTVVLNGVRCATVTSLNDQGVPFWDIAQAIRAEYLKDEG